MAPTIMTPGGPMTAWRCELCGALVAPLAALEAHKQAHKDGKIIRDWTAGKDRHRPKHWRGRKKK